MEFSAPRKLFAGGLDLDRIVGTRRHLTSETSKILEANSDPDTILDLIAFAASANVPLFSMLEIDSLTAPQKHRYMDILQRFCEQTLVPSYHVLMGSEPRKVCAEIQAAKIRRRLDSGHYYAHDHYNLGLALLAAGRQDEAVEAFRQTVSMDPFHAKAYTALGLLSAETGSLKEAVTYLSQAEEVAPLDADVHRNLGMVEARLGNVAEARIHLNTALKIRPQDVVTLNELGSLLLEQGKIREAIEYYSNALLLDPEHAESHHNLGMAFFKLNKLEDALKHFSEAHRISPENANVRYNIERVSTLLRQSGKIPADSP